MGSNSGTLGDYSISVIVDWWWYRLMTRKRSNKLDRPIHEIAHSFAVRFIGSYGIKDAEQVAKLCYEKVVASRKGLECKYGERK